MWWFVATAVAGPLLTLESVDYTVDVAGPLAEIVITQRFRNTAESFVDATYLFPLDPRATVDAMVLTVRDRTLRSEIRSRQEARERYERAAAEGHVAALTEQQRPNVFTQQVSHLPPGEVVEVELHVVQPVNRVDGQWELVVPLVVGPRFVPPGEANEVDASYVAPDRVDRRDNAGGSGVQATVDVVVHAGTPLFGLVSPSHPVPTVVHETDGRVRFDSVPLTRDVVVQWRTAADDPATALLVSGTYGMLLVEPPVLSNHQPTAPREIVWVVDTSCSMQGEPLALAKQAMETALHSMDERDSFLVLSFNSGVRGLTERPVVATRDEIEAGVRFVRSLQSSGGTMMIPALQAALALPVDPKRRRMVVFVTDGLVSNDAGVLKAIAQSTHVTFVALGIGSAPNRSLLDEMATIGGGVAAYALLDGDAGAAMELLVEAMARPVWSDLVVDWGECVTQSQVPSHLPDLRMGRPVRILARFDGPCTSGVTLRTRDGSGSFAVKVSPQVIPRDRAMASAWARERVSEVERLERWGDAPDGSEQIRRIGLDARIVTRETSFVVVDPEVMNPLADADEVHVPLDRPDGIQVGAVSGMSLQREFLQRIPAGRTYHSAVQTVPGVQNSSGGNPSISGGGTNENVYIVDGHYVVDPVVGQFALDFDRRSARATRFGGLPSSSGGATGASWSAPEGRNELDGEVTVGGGVTDRATLLGGRGAGALAGPWVRDQLWFGVAASAETRSVVPPDAAGVVTRTLDATARVAAQAGAHHRVTLQGAAESSSVGQTTVVPYGTFRGRASWLWAPEPRIQLWTVASGVQRTVGTVRRDLLEVRTVAFRDGTGHALGAGLGVARSDWTDLDAAVLASGSVEDRWSLRPNLTLAGGVRLDALRDEGWFMQASPRLFLKWEPALGRTTVDVEAARYTEPHRWFPDLRLPTSEIFALRVRRAVVRDLWLEVDGRATRSAFPFAPAPEWVPVPGEVETVNRTVPQLRLGVRKSLARRWDGELAWVLTPTTPVNRALLLDPQAPFVPGFLDVYRAHSWSAGAQWALPTDPWTATFGIRATGATAIEREAEVWWLAPRTQVQVWYFQAFDVRKGTLELRLAGWWVDNDPTATVLPVQAFVLLPDPPSVGDLPTFRGEASLSWLF